MSAGALLLSVPACDGSAPSAEAPPTTDAVPRLPPDGSRARPFIGRGVITEIRGDVVQIDHETIPGFMVAVTMDFPVEDPAVFRGLVPGDRVSFSLLRPNDQSYRILGIERLVDPPE